MGSSPSALREDLADTLRAADRNLHAVARAARIHLPRQDKIGRALADAWSSLATIERAAGLQGNLSRAAVMRRFVVVDDDDDSRFLATRTLRSMAPHAIVESASGAEQALALLQDAGAGDGVTVVSDHDMGPGPSGIDLLATVATRHPRTHRVLFTGHPTERFRERNVQAHALLSKDQPDALRHYFGAP